MSLHGTKLSVIGAIDYGSNSNPTRRWPQLTINEEVDGAVHTDTVVPLHGETNGTMGLEATQALPTSDGFRRRRFWTKIAVSATTKGFT